MQEPLCKIFTLEMLTGVYLWLVTDVSGQLISPVSNSEAAQGSSNSRNCFTGLTVLYLGSNMSVVCTVLNRTKNSVFIYITYFSS